MIGVCGGDFDLLFGYVEGVGFCVGSLGIV